MFVFLSFFCSYAVVAFGGNGMFSTPHTVTVDSAEFTTAKQISEYFDYVSSGITKGKCNFTFFYHSTN